MINDQISQEPSEEGWWWWRWCVRPVVTVEAGGWCWLGDCGSETMMVAGLTLLLCLSLTAIHCNIEFKHHNNTELAAILQKVRERD